MMIDKQTERTQIAQATSDSSMVHGVHIGGIYLHRNGHQYKVLAVACNTEDLSWNVVYEALYENPVAHIWCRKLEDFLATITLEDGTKQPRFIYQDPTK